MIILGIDPGTARAGFGVLKIENQTIKLVSCGLLTGQTKTHSDRLCEIRKKITTIIQEQKPDRAVVETLFFSKNKKTAISVAEARGVIIQTIAEFGIPILELSPNQIKLALTGNGNASKIQIKKMLSIILKSEFSHMIDDTTDAVAASFAGTQKHIL